MTQQLLSHNRHFKFIDCSINSDNGGGDIILNRPKKRNAINFSVIDEIGIALSSLNQSPEVSWIRITGEGTGFCAGDDIGGMGTPEHPLPDDPFARAGMGYVRLVESVWRSGKPVLASVHGFAAGAGAMLMLAADLICVDPHTSISFPFTKLGITAGSLVDQLGIPFHMANMLLYTGGSVSPSSLFNLGIVSLVGNGDERDAWIEETGRNIKQASPSALQTIKSVRMSSRLNVGAALSTEQQLVAAGYGHPDYMEGKMAFLEKRQPNFIQAVSSGN